MPVLVLTRKPGEAVRIRVGGEEIDVVLGAIRGNKASLCFHAASHVLILREELDSPQDDPKERSVA